MRATLHDLPALNIYDTFLPDAASDGLAGEYVASLCDYEDGGNKFKDCHFNLVPPGSNYE